MAHPKTVESEQPLTLEQRRMFAKLPIVERRRRLAEQAEKMAQYFETDEDFEAREEWQGGDIVEC